MKNLLLLLFVAGLLAGCTTSTNTGGNTTQIIHEIAELQVYTILGEPTGSAFLEVPFLANSDEEWYLNVYADLDGDGIIREYTLDDGNIQQEWIVKDAQPRVLANLKNRVSFALLDNRVPGLDSVNVSVTLSNNPATVSNSAPNFTFDVDATVAHFSGDVSLGIGVPGASEDLKRGIPIFMNAYAHGNDIDIQREGDIPDLSGGPMDCFPISAANNLISLANEHNRRGDLPTNTTEMINELKQDMQFSDGVLKRNFKAGKDAFVARHNLPITTTVIERPSFDDLKNALESGAAVEVSTTMIRSRSGRANTGHVLTGVGVQQADGQSGMTVHDPATGPGAEMYELNTTADGKFLIFNYPMWDGITFIDSIFIQTWNTTSTTGTTGTSTTTDEGTGLVTDGGTAITTGAGDTGTTGTGTGTTDAPFGEGSQEIEVLIIGGKKYPKSQFWLSDGGGHFSCEAQHWHSDSRVFAIDDDVGIVDPQPNACGFGKVSEVTVENATITEAQASRFLGSVLAQ